MFVAWLGAVQTQDDPRRDGPSACGPTRESVHPRARSRAERTLVWSHQTALVEPDIAAPSWLLSGSLSLGSGGENWIEHRKPISRRFEVGRRKALSEAAVGFGKLRTRFGSLSLRLPQPGETHRSSQLQPPRMLPPG